ncbi:hypothetical protein BJ508DRAFT_416803 [Ascobolus immersus RN42]|uniref:Uncharacterized protein n=1 Tax=Ascobolus immersus RN42 TaxID=1160509 RepID=A0A3N4HVW2_ASCIM|nr:hypothetical protein BJ508DRAFT_416803 [Ascobolus immersus RN42]
MPSSSQQLTVRPVETQTIYPATEFRLVIFKNLTETNRSKGFKQWEYAKRSTQTTTLEISLQEIEYHARPDRSLATAFSKLGPKRSLHILNYIRELNEGETDFNFHWVVMSLRCNGKSHRNDIPDTMWCICARVPRDANIGFGFTPLSKQFGILEDLSQGGVLQFHGIGTPPRQQTPPQILKQTREQILEAAMRQALPPPAPPVQQQAQQQQARPALLAPPPALAQPHVANYPPPPPPPLSMGLQPGPAMTSLCMPPPPPPPPAQPQQSMQALGAPPPPPPPPPSTQAQQHMQRFGGQSIPPPPPPPSMQAAGRPPMPQPQQFPAATQEQSQASAKEEEALAVMIAENKRQQELLMNSIVEGLVPAVPEVDVAAADAEVEAHQKELEEIERKLRKFKVNDQQRRMPLLLRQSSSSDVESLSSGTTDSESEGPRTPRLEYARPSRSHKSSHKSKSSYDYDQADYDRAGYMRSSYDEMLELEKKRRERAAKATRLSAVERNQWRSGYGAYSAFSMDAVPRQPDYSRRCGRDSYNGSGYGGMDQRSEYSADSIKQFAECSLLSIVPVPSDLEVVKVDS